MQMRVEQDGDKAITCPDDNAMLGRYFRERIGVESGKAITAAALYNYGKTSVVFTKLNDELFYMDFSNGREEHD